MKGEVTKNFVDKIVLDALTSFLQSHQIDPGAVDYFLPHQASLTFMRGICMLACFPVLN